MQERLQHTAQPAVRRHNEGLTPPQVPAVRYAALYLQAGTPHQSCLISILVRSLPHHLTSLHLFKNRFVILHFFHWDCANSSLIPFKAHTAAQHFNGSSL